MNLKNICHTVFLFVLTGNALLAQDTIYFDKFGKETSLKEEAKDYEVHYLNAEDPDKVIVRKYHDNGQLEYEFPYSSYKEKIAHGTYRTWYEDGMLRSEREYFNGKSHGPFITYWDNGQKKREDHYKKGRFKEGRTWDESGNEVPYYNYEIRPEFPGGEKALLKYLKANAKKPNGSKGGKVKVGFVIDVDGNVVETRIEESSSLDLNWAAYEVVRKMPAWKPGQHDGKKVRVKYTLPLNFL